MLRRRFLTGEEKPDFIITYYAPLHIPFASNLKGVLRGYDNIADFGDETNTVFKCVLDKWNDGIGEYGIKILNWVDATWYNFWSYKNSLYPTNFNFGALGFYIDVVDGVQEDVMDFANTITDVIFPNEIKHLKGVALINALDEYNYSVANVILPEKLETLSNGVLKSLHALKTITIPRSVIYMGMYTLLINCYNDDFMSILSGNYSLEEIIMKPIVPPSTDNDKTPIGIYEPNHYYINPNLKVRVYADCIDTYKNDAVWGQYSDLYDTINSAIVYKTNNGKPFSAELIGETIQTDDNTFILDLNQDITIIPESCFNSNENNYQLIEVYLPNTLTTINKSAFLNARNLRKINIPDSVQIVQQYAFDGCYFGKNNVIGDYTKITEGGGRLFDIETEDGYFIDNYSIGKIFCGFRPAVKNVIISDDIDYIKDSLENTAWSNRTLESIYIGKNIKGCRFSATQSTDMRLTLGYSNNIKSLKVDPLNSYYDSRDDCNAIIETATNTLLVGCPTTIVPNTVEIIKYNHAFEDINIETLNIPLSVKKITDMYRRDTVNSTKINTIIYEGTIEQWNAIEKTGTVYEAAAITIKCSNGEIKYFTTT